MISPRQFVDTWGQSTLRETQGYQSHFNELCQMLGHKTPTQLDPKGEFFTFEENVEKATGGRGRADVWYKDHFAWEYKGKHKDLDAAYAQVLAYRGGLGNPPLLVVCDFNEYRIYPQWPNTSGLPFVFKNEDLLDKRAQNYIRWLLEDPDKFLEERRSELERREQITLSLAEKFAHLADLMRHADAGWTPMQIARFLTKLVFALFAEDIELLPTLDEQGIIRYIAEAASTLPEGFVDIMSQLFSAMDGQRVGVWGKRVPYFNGGLFADSRPGAGDGLEVLDITTIPGALQVLQEVSEADWKAVNPTIFGTLFEGALDTSKRAQLGAHYTGEADIRLVIEPVLMGPLHRLWDETRAAAEPLLLTYLTETAPRPRQAAYDGLLALHTRMVETLAAVRVLDPACGSGNFLYVSLRALKDLEGVVRKFFEPLELPFKDVVTPRQLYGIEKDEFAARLAHVVVWIGYLQWRFEDEGRLHFYNPRDSVPHPRQLPNPIIQDKTRPDEPERIVNDDAIMRYDDDGQPYEPEWPEVDVIIGNPPFLGGNRIRAELGTYVDDLFRLYDDRVPAFADLVCYWFEKARANIESDRAKRAGLLATNSIRGGVNREVLERIKQSGDIFMAWSDRAWVLDGAAVRISIVGFDGMHPAPNLTDAQLHPTPNPSPKLWGGEQAATTDVPPFPNALGKGPGDGVDEAGWIHTNTPPEIYKNTKLLARQMRGEPTPAENALWQRLRKNQIGGFRFRRQHTIDRFIVDFYCPEARLVIEVDGAIHEYTQEEDAIRQAFLESLGLRVLRFTNGEVLQQIDGVVTAIDEALHTTPSTHDPSSAPLHPTPNPAPKLWGGEQVSESAGLPPFPIAMGKGPGDGVKFLDGLPVATINADLTAGVELTTAKHMTENENISYSGTKKGGAFDITEKLARQMLSASNPSGRSNADVVKPWLNGTAIVGEPTKNTWIIDFGTNREEEYARLYEAPYNYIKEKVYPVRSSNRRATRAHYWWLHSEVASGLRNAVRDLPRFIATPRVSKYRLFAWYPANTIPDDGIYIFARDDDYFFGVLHSYLHEIWALRLGTSLEDRPRYTPTTTFETFPFPWPPGKEDTASPAYQAISAAAQTLHQERHLWLNPPDLLSLGAGEDSPALRERTLTNLYNAVEAERARTGQAQSLQDAREGKNGGNGNGNGGEKNGRIPKAARDFAPRLTELHAALDKAVLAAYGWDDLAERLRTAEGDEELLRRLLALNLARAGVSAAPTDDAS